MKKQRRKKKKLNFKVLLLFALIIAIVVFIGNKMNSKNTNTEPNTPSNDTSTAQSNTSNSTNTAVEKKSVVDSLTADEIEQSKKRGLPVLMYHFFYDASAGETGRDNNYIEISDFEKQIKYLHDNNYYVPTWEEVLGYVNGKNGLPLKSVVITVDDGDDSFFNLAVPVLEKYNFTATSFLVTSWYGYRAQSNPSASIDFQSHSDDMHKAGTGGKGAFLTLSYEEACNDLKQSRSVIGDGCVVFCYPFGHYSDACKKTLKDCNYILAFTTQGGRVFPGDDPYELPRVRMSKGDSLDAFISKVK